MVIIMQSNVMTAHSRKHSHSGTHLVRVVSLLLVYTNVAGT